MTYVFFIVSYYRKVLFSFALISNFNGYIQTYFAISINGIYLVILFYMIVRKYYNSKAKMLAKLINVISILII